MEHRDATAPASCTSATPNTGCTGLYDCVHEPKIGGIAVPDRSEGGNEINRCKRQQANKQTEALNGKALDVLLLELSRAAAQRLRSAQQRSARFKHLKHCRRIRIHPNRSSLVLQSSGSARSRTTVQQEIRPGRPENSRLKSRPQTRDYSTTISYRTVIR